VFKTKLCKYFVEKGACVLGEACRFAHGHDDLGEKDSIRTSSTTIISPFQSSDGPILSTKPSSINDDHDDDDDDGLILEEIITTPSESWDDEDSPTDHMVSPQILSNDVYEMKERRNSSFASFWNSTRRLSMIAADIQEMLK
jgi:Zinc finger C-x8-C-x5-C-x3-H type (and similar)